MKKIIKTYSLIAVALLLSSCTVKEHENLNVGASVTTLGNLPENPLLLTPMATSINRKEGAMSTLYGNDLAVKYAEVLTDGKYPPGALLYKVTWQAHPDSLWFGANIPQTIKLVERVSFYDNTSPQYTAYQGKTLKKTQTSQENIVLRINAITAEKMAVSP